MNARQWWLIHCKVTFPLLLNAVSILAKNLAHLSGLPFCQYWNMAFTYTKVIFGMLFLYIMVSHHLIHQVLASVEPPSQLTMHAMVYPFGGFPTIRHNEVRDLTASLITKMCHNFAIEPSLQPITSVTFSLASANTTNDACLDVKARGFWSRGQDAYFDVRVFYSNASSYRSLSLNSVYKYHEDVKK